MTKKMKMDHDMDLRDAGATVLARPERAQRWLDAEQEDELQAPVPVFELDEETLAPDEDGVVAGRHAEEDEEEAPDNVRAYLREIGQVKLLTFADEQRLARAMEEGNYLKALDARIQAQTGRPATTRELHEALLADLTELRPVLAAAAKVAGLRGKPERHIDDPAVRALIDAAPDERLVQKLTAKGLSDEEAVRQVIRLSTVTRILPAELRDAHAPLAAVEARLRQVRKAGQEAEQRLIQANLRLVVSVAKKYLGRGMPLLDLVQEGNLGLMRAVQKFEYRRGFKFSTYATWWIRQSITRAIADYGRTIRMPVHMVELVNKLQRVSRQLVQHYGREPSFEEIGRELGMSGERVAEILRAAQETVSLETPVGDEEESELGDFIEDTGMVAPVQAATQNLMKLHVAQALATLSEREQKVLKLRFGIEDGRARTLEEVGRELGVTRERIRQIEAKALRTLRHPSRSHTLKDFLE